MFAFHSGSRLVPYSLMTPLLSSLTKICALTIPGTAEIAGDAEKECKGPRAAVSKLIWLLFARLCSR